MSETVVLFSHWLVLIEIWVPFNVLNQYQAFHFSLPRVSTISLRKLSMEQEFFVNGKQLQQHFSTWNETNPVA